MSAPALRLGCLCWLGAAAVSIAAPARAQTAPDSIETITVVGSSPLIGGGVDRTLIPADTEVLGQADLTRNGTPNALAALNTAAARVNLDDSAGNPYQPALFYDGFEASPLQGTPEGLAVYLNGVRFNQAFGDTVNWDLIPEGAIGKLNLEGANPVYGLNALGGAINVRLKDGFTDPGGSLTLGGGSFGQIETDVEDGITSGNKSLYVAGAVRHEGGWRDLQSSDIQNFFADWGIRGGDGELHITLTAANSDLNGPGSAPVEWLAVNPAVQFTAPNLVANRFLQPALRLNVPLDDALSLQATAYYNYFLQKVANGNTPNDFPCNDGSNLLCSAPGTPSTTRGLVPIEAFLGQSPYSQLNDQTTNTNGYGAAVQLTDTGRLGGLTNHLVVGTSFDGAQTEFGATALLGGLDANRAFTGPGVVIDEPGNNVPVRAAITGDNAGAFASDTLNLTPALALTLSGRFNFAEIDLRDHGGGDLNGNHAYARFNPAAGATWRATFWLTLYGGYAEANRAPTPAELSCAGPQNSCSLANFFVGDPDLRQVVAHTFEAGARGNFSGFALPLAGAARLDYDFGLFHTISDNDIAFINSVRLGRAYFANVGSTRRQGFSAHLGLHAGAASAAISYSYTEATYQTGFVEAAGSNPAADANGNITIRPGNQLPGVPRSILKFTLDGTLTKALHAGLDAQLQSGQYLFGDEANLTPRLPGFFVLNLHASYDLTRAVGLFVNVSNALDRRYYTYGTFSPTGSVYFAQAPNATNPRSYSPAAPVSAFGGLKISF